MHLGPSLHATPFQDYANRLIHHLSSTIPSRSLPERFTSTCMRIYQPMTNFCPSHLLCHILATLASCNPRVFAPPQTPPTLPYPVPHPPVLVFPNPPVLANLSIPSTRSPLPGKGHEHQCLVSRFHPTVPSNKSFKLCETE